LILEHSYDLAESIGLEGTAITLNCLLEPAMSGKVEVYFNDPLQPLLWSEFVFGGIPHLYREEYLTLVDSLTSSRASRSAPEFPDI